MNIYQRLSQEYKEFKIKERLVEAEKAKKLNESSLVAEPLEEAPNDNVTSELDTINTQLEEIQEALTTATDPEEIKDLESQKATLLDRLDAIDRGLVKDNEEAPAEENAEVVTESSVSVTVDGEGNTDVSVNTDETTASVAVTEEPAVDQVPVEPPVEETPIEEPIEEPITEETPEVVDDEIKDSEEPKKTVCKECGKECEGELCEECSKSIKETDEEAPSEDAPTEEAIVEAEVTSYKVTRISPKAGAYMIEAQTKDGLTYITGKNWDEKELTLDEAEMTNDRAQATDRFKSLLK